MHFAWLLLRSSRIPSLSEQALANLCPAFFFFFNGALHRTQFRLLTTGKLTCWSFSDVTNLCYTFVFFKVTLAKERNKFILCT